MVGLVHPGAQIPIDGEKFMANYGTNEFKGGPLT